MMPTRWSQSWSARRTNVRTFEAYTAWSLYLLLGILPFVLVRWHAAFMEVNESLTALFWAMVITETIVAIIVVRRVVVALRHQAPLPYKLSIALLVIAVITLGIASPLIRDVQTAPGEAALWLPVMVVAYAVAVAATTLPKRVSALVAVGGIALAYAAWRFIGISGAAIPAFLIAVTLMTVFFAISMRASISMLRLMHEIDRSRAVGAQLAVAEERLRFARDLHDTLGRNLSAIALKSQVAARLSTRDTGAATEEMGAVQRLAEESLTEMRAVVRGYREIDLPAELRGAQSLLRAADIDARVEIDPKAAPPELHEGIGAVVREAVTNVIRHSAATHCTLSAEADGDEYVVRISNDSPKPLRSGGTGISGLAQRLEALGGTVEPRWSADEFVLTASFGRARPDPTTATASTPQTPSVRVRS